ncbi:hypothetical protein [Methylobrevis pamukkalensis]|uniref:Sulfotransferase family protein n=1 Tax=Methylobrevis pamukkalensis TaxID=1439726 RepID=A0A1E3GYE3_9HYPH|nr:hypothetical protein [Methylobrevis pamukkalensis]ODN69044.1 hypothetical protein A6302_03640 [Methylobrevis pamukkalensis]
MRELLLHVGHDKTGSSYIESALARSVSALMQHGITYPVPHNMERAANGGITSGNIMRLEEAMSAGADTDAPEARIFFSSELLFGRFFGRKGETLTLEALANTFAVDRIRILLFIRDPIDHLCSSYQQRVKRSGATMSTGRFARRYGHPQLVRDFLDIVAASDLAEVTVFNYSRHRKEILRIVSDWLGLPEGTLALPAFDNVNRSMTHSELEIQKIINERLGNSGHLWSDPLCEKAPDIRSSDIRPSVENQTLAFERLKPYIDEVNACLPAAEHYRRDIAEGEKFPADTFTLNRQQMEILIGAFSDEIVQLREQVAALKVRAAERRKVQS